jgi:hypothetical protein
MEDAIVILVVEMAAKGACRMFGYWEWTKLLAVASDTLVHLYRIAQTRFIAITFTITAVVDAACICLYYIGILLHCIPPFSLAVGMTRTATMSPTAAVRS